MSGTNIKNVDGQLRALGRAEVRAPARAVARFALGSLEFERRNVAPAGNQAGREAERARPEREVFSHEYARGENRPLEGGGEHGLERAAVERERVDRIRPQAAGRRRERHVQQRRGRREASVVARQPSGCGNRPSLAFRCACPLDRRGKGFAQHSVRGERQGGVRSGTGRGLRPNVKHGVDQPCVQHQHLTCLRGAARSLPAAGRGGGR